MVFVDGLTTIGELMTDAIERGGVTTLETTDPVDSTNEVFVLVAVGVMAGQVRQILEEEFPMVH